MGVGAVGSGLTLAVFNHVCVERFCFHKVEFALLYPLSRVFVLSPLLTQRFDWVM